MRRWEWKPRISSFRIQAQLINSYNAEILLLKRQFFHFSKTGLEVASQSVSRAQPLPNIVFFELRSPHIFTWTLLSSLQFWQWSAVIERHAPWPERHRWDSGRHPSSGSTYSDPALGHASIPVMGRQGWARLPLLHLSSVLCYDSPLNWTPCCEDFQLGR